jgi:acyl-coenzyme A thioesterase PaaI-like protein
MPPITREDETAVQDVLDHENPCFGCGPANPKGLQLKSYPREDANGLVAEYQGEKHLAGSAGVLGGGPLATLADCHGIWTATHHAIEQGKDPVPHYVTAEMEIQYRQPTPLTEPIRIVSEIASIDGRRVEVDIEVLDEDDQACTSARVHCHRLDDAWGENPYHD